MKTLPIVSRGQAAAASASSRSTGAVPQTLALRAARLPAPWRQARTGGRSTLAAGVAAVLLGLLLAPAHAAADEHHEAQRGATHQRGDVPRDHDRDRNRDEHGYRRGNYYPQPVYVPPVVEYVPPQSPGISLFVPLNIRLH